MVDNINIKTGILKDIQWQILVKGQPIITNNVFCAGLELSAQRFGKTHGQHPRLGMCSLSTFLSSYISVLRYISVYIAY